MNDENVQSILQDAMEEEIPASQVDLWPAVKADLAAGKHPQNRKGNPMNTLNPSRISRFALAITLFLALLIVFFATPQGRSFAQNVLALFTRAESIDFPVDDAQIAPFDPDPASPTALPPSPLISVAEAEAQAGFNLAEIPYVPEGLDYLGARMYGDYVSIEYQTPDLGGHLILMQSREGFYESDWDNVPAEAVVPVKVGELEGEFVRGTFVVYPGETTAAWNQDAPILRLRWQKDGVWFELAKYGDAQAIDYLDQAGLVALAESLATQP
ncbi:MAG: hypothetical protein R3335_00380 [Anaerolineales bacterium]|nr:hypothetical protein [Anaerolineales bacterium]